MTEAVGGALEGKIAHYHSHWLEFSRSVGADNFRPSAARHHDPGRDRECQNSFIELHRLNSFCSEVITLGSFPNLASSSHSSMVCSASSARVSWL